MPLAQRKYSLPFPLRHVSRGFDESHSSSAALTNKIYLSKLFGFSAKILASSLFLVKIHLIESHAALTARCVTDEFLWIGQALRFLALSNESGSTTENQHEGGRIPKDRLLQVSS